MSETKNCQYVLFRGGGAVEACALFAGHKSPHSYFPELAPAPEPDVDAYIARLEHEWGGHQ